MSEYGYPFIADKDKIEVTRIATSPQSPPELQSLATWGLAISGYSSESYKIAIDKTLGNREIAAMGLGNFTTQLDVHKKEEFRAGLREIVTSEGLGAPHGIIQTLIALNDSPWIAERLGSNLAVPRVVAPRALPV